MPNSFEKAIQKLTSFGFAVAVLSILFGASVAGWILTETIPFDFAARKDLYADRWGAATARAVELFRLYDPFHSIWYRSVLALFFFVLLICLCARWRRFIVRSVRINPPSGMGDVGGKGPRCDISWSEIAAGDEPRDPLTVLGKRYGKDLEIDGELRTRLFMGVKALLSKRGYHVVSADAQEGNFFTAVAGRWRFVGSFIFHTGILVIVVGGMIGSFWGSTAFVSGRPGDTVPIGGSPYSLRIEDFQIIMAGRMEIKDYVTRVSILDRDGDTLTSAEFEVNRPLTFKGYRIYQSSYFIDENEFKWARIEVIEKETMRTMLVTLERGDEVDIEGTGLSIRPRRFFPDFRMDARGPFSASATMSNPALEVEIAGETEVQRGWLFLHNPRFNSRFTLPVLLRLVDIEPVFHTGLQVSTNPGSTTLLCGIAAATIGLCLIYLVQYRLIRGLVGRERFIIAAAGYTWKVSFAEEFDRMCSALKDELHGIIGGERTI
jgi:cytochrome c biogenesis protein